ncbi:MAG: cyanophycin synthetase [Candidatus Daviesbacteria bacterium]|nr:cyanophycin synthetase [Candidatus Daviesbacteria bacterium]
MVKRVHFLGIGGSGASAAAAIAQSQGFEVTGCDLEPNNEFTTQFKSDQLLKEHSASHLTSGNVDILAVTPAIFSLDPNNPELREARKRGIEIMTWQEFLGKYLTKDKFVIAVCGTHGKTTTTAMIAKMLEDAGLDPTVELGAIVPWWKANYRIGQGKYFVIEADEFNDNFLHLKPDITIVTNIEMDHPEYFKDFTAVRKSFAKFESQSKKVFDKPNPELIKFKLKVPGKFNVANASLALQVGLTLGLDPEIIRKSLENFTGASRRFEYIGEFSGAKVYSDFGHHPTEIEKTMEASREKFPKKRILLVYQPHMFSRTKALFSDFVRVFKNIQTDEQSSRASRTKTFIMDIYPSREIDTGLVTSQQLVDAIGKENVTYIGSASETLEKLKPEIKRGDIVFFMSAGDTDKLAKTLVTAK